MHHGVNLARDAVLAATKSKVGCGIQDTDYMAAFDYFVMHWVFRVLAKKGLSDKFIARLKNLYNDNINQLSIQLNSTKLIVIMIIGVSHPTHQELSRHFQMT